MNRNLIGSAVLVLVFATPFALTGCENKPSATVQSKQVATVDESQKRVVTDENYGLAESEVIFSDYVGRFAAATGTNGVGVLVHNKIPPDPKDRAIVRINFDTLYSSAIVDLTEDAVLTMPKTNGRYQSAWIITDEHYNPMAFVEPGTYTLTRENVGRRYAMIAIRTQANMNDPADLAIANELQEKVKLEQKDRGSYQPSGTWDMEEILIMRAKYQKIGMDEGIPSEVLFGKKGEVPLKEHNVGTSAGWGGFTPARAVYPQYYPDSADPQTLTLRNVPARAFWSVTVYDAEGYPQGDIFNINSQFAAQNEDGSVIIHFGGDENADNYMDIFEGWNFTLRLYEPTEAYFNGEWVLPKLEIVE